MPASLRSVAGTPSSGRADAASRAIVGLVSLGLVLMVGRVVQLQLAPSEKLVQQAQPRIATVGLEPLRGDVRDRRGRLLATSRFGYRVFIDPVEFPKEADEPIALLAEALKVPADKLGEHILTAMAENQRRAALMPAEEEVPPPMMKQWLGGLLTKLHAIAKTEPLKAAGQTGLKQSPEDPDEVDPDEAEQESPKPIRYLRVTDVVDDGVIAAIKKLGIKGVHLQQRLVREYPGGSAVAPIVGRLGGQLDPQSGAERSHNKDLSGQVGKVSYTRDSAGRPLWMGPGSFETAEPGKPLRLSIDLEIQRMATEELVRGVYEADAAGGRLIVMDTVTGEIVAMVDIIRPVPDAVPFPWIDAPPKAKKGEKPSGLLYEPPPTAPRRRYITIFPDPQRAIDPALGRNRCVQDVYEPGSTFKPFAWATITQLGALHANDIVDTEGGHWRTPYGRSVSDVHKHPQLSWSNVLVESSNIGMGKGALKIGFDQLRNAIMRFGFGSRSGVGLPGETPGLITPRKKWTVWTQTSVAFGQEVAVTPVQMARAFCIFARTGELAGTLPPARLTAVDEGEKSSEVLHRVIKPEVAVQTRDILRIVARQMEGKMAEKDKTEVGWRYSIFGKSGTAQIPLGKPPPGKRVPPGNKGFYDQQYNSSFIAAGPTERPRLVCLVVIDDPGPELRKRLAHFGAHVAGPVVRRTLERSLTYLGAPPSPPSDVAVPAGPMAD